MCALRRCVCRFNAGCADILDFPFYYSNLVQESMGSALIQYGLQNDTAPCGSCEHAERPLCKRGSWVGFTLIESSSDDYTCVSTTCADILPYCHLSNVVGIRARMICSSTCGCDDPISPLALARPEVGCPKRCDRTVTYKARLQQLPCEYVNRTDPNFVALLDHMDAAADSWPFDWGAGGNAIIALIRREGCNYFQQIDSPAGIYPSFPADIYVNANLCVRDTAFGYPFRALSIFCPVSCGCLAGDIDCPDSCPLRPQTRSGNMTSRVVDYSNIEPNYILPVSALRVPAYVPPPLS